MKTLKITLMLSAVLFLLNGCAVFSPSYESFPANKLLKNYHQVESEQTGWIVFTPTTTRTTTGVVFYPGGKVEPESYMPFADELSQRANAKVVIVTMPLDLALLGSAKGNQVRETFPEIRNWYLTGHSLGGLTAATLFKKDPAAWKGLGLLASYTKEKHDFSATRYPMISIIGERDGLISMEEWKASLARLSSTKKAHIIKGGNHSGFGNYGPQEDDNPAGIKPAVQQSSTAQLLTNWIKMSNKN